ncbi:MAG: hypothetical protein NW208_10155 [Bryobacter sp.]|nr:hypothetical protein [Bryobacter sp.]
MLLLLLASAPPISAQRGPSAPPTYTRDIAPLLARHCTECHRAGEVGPFPLDTFLAASRHAKLIAEVTAARYMPPYKATAASLPFHNERRLSNREIALFAAWARNGAPSGAPHGAPSRTSPLAPPPPEAPFDLTFTLPTPYSLPAEGRDLYRCFVVPTAAAQPRYINAFRFLPGNPAVVHHALFFFDLSGAARKLDAEHPGPGYPCFGSPGFLPTSSLGGWSPGNRTLRMPPNTAVRLPAGADLVMQIHYRLTGKPEADQSRLAVRFAPSAPAKRLLDIPLTSNQIDIPPGKAAYRVQDSFEVPVDVTLWQIIPHAHFLAQRVRAWATLPNQPRRTLLAIDDWDFNWQDIYQLRTPLLLPAGTLLEMEILYNNTAANPRNPHSPPRRVTWGFSTSDEMAGMHFNITVDDEAADLSDLTSSLWGKMIRTLGIGIPKR